MQFQALFAAVLVFLTNVMFIMAAEGNGDLTVTIKSTIQVTSTSVIGIVTKTGDPAEHSGTDYQVVTTLPTTAYQSTGSLTSTGTINVPKNTSIPTTSAPPKATETTGAAAGALIGSVPLAGFVGAVVVVAGMW